MKVYQLNSNKNVVGIGRVLSEWFNGTNVFPNLRNDTNMFRATHRSAPTN